MGPLKGIKVLDLSRILAGPWSTQLLADFGAEVWKIEQPNTGDDTRKWGPPFLNDEDGNPTSESAYYLSANRGKDSLTIDITQKAGQEIIHQLIQNADILVENFKMGGLAKYNLDYPSIKALNPRLIYCSITGFGQTGPDSARPGYDAMIQGMGGLMSLTGVAPGEPGAGPQKVGVAVADLMTGMYATTAILAALHHRSQTGEGQQIDLALLDTQVAWLANQGMNHLIGGDIPEPKGTAHPNIVPYQSFATRDGHIMLAVGNDRQFADCCRVIGKPELAEEDNYKTNSQRVKHRNLLIPIMETLFENFELDMLILQFNEASVPCGPINTLDRVFNEPQVKHRQMVTKLKHASGVDVPQIANPIKFSKSTIEYSKAPPPLGLNTKNILKQELGLNDADIASLKEQQVI